MSLSSPCRTQAKVETETHLERLEVREKRGFTDVLRSRSWGPEKLATCRLRGALLPGAKEAGGPLSCREEQVRTAGSSPPSPGHTCPHLEKHWSHSARLGGSPAQALAPSILASKLQGEGRSNGQQCGWQGGSQEASFRGSHRLQGHPAQMSALWDPPKDNMGEVWLAILRVVSRDQPCHFHQQLGLQP